MRFLIYCIINEYGMAALAPVLVVKCLAAWLHYCNFTADWQRELGSESLYLCLIFS